MEGGDCKTKCDYGDEHQEWGSCIVDTADGDTAEGYHKQDIFTVVMLVEEVAEKRLEDVGGKGIGHDKHTAEGQGDAKFGNQYWYQYRQERLVIIVDSMTST